MICCFIEQNCQARTYILTVQKRPSRNLSASSSKPATARADSCSAALHCARDSQRHAIYRTAAPLASASAWNIANPTLDWEQCRGTRSHGARLSSQRVSRAILYIFETRSNAQRHPLCNIDTYHYDAPELRNPPLTERKAWSGPTTSSCFSNPPAPILRPSSSRALTRHLWDQSYDSLKNTSVIWGPHTTRSFVPR